MGCVKMITMYNLSGCMRTVIKNKIFLKVISEPIRLHQQEGNKADHK